MIICFFAGQGEASGRRRLVCSKWLLRSVAAAAAAGAVRGASFVRSASAPPRLRLHWLACPFCSSARAHSQAFAASANYLCRICLPAANARTERRFEAAKVCLKATRQATLRCGAHAHTGQRAPERSDAAAPAAANLRSARHLAPHPQHATVLARAFPDLIFAGARALILRAFGASHRRLDPGRTGCQRELQAASCSCNKADIGRAFRTLLQPFALIALDTNAAGAGKTNDLPADNDKQLAAAAHASMPPN